MEINIRDIPEEKTFDDYPKDTIFVFEETPRPKRDPKTGFIIRD